jgi:hypothetical protein
LDAAGVFEDARHDAVGELEGAAGGGAIHAGLAARAHGFEEGAQLGAQWFFWLRRQFFKVHLRLGFMREADSGLDANAQDILAREIE